MAFIILMILAVAQASVIQENCDGVNIRGVRYERETLKEASDTYIPSQLAINFDTKTLFFGLIDRSVEGYAQKSAYINLRTNEFGTIPGINNGYASAVDKKNHVVYLGGEDGLYTYDFDSKTAKHVAGEVEIGQLFYKDRLYYINKPEEKVYYYENGETKKVEELKDTKAKLVAVDKDNNIFFYNASGLFVYNQDNSTTLSLGTYDVYDFTVDNNGNLYFSAIDTIYSISGDINKGLEITKLVELDSVFGIVFDNDNSIIYSEFTKIVKLTPSKKK